MASQPHGSRAAIGAARAIPSAESATRAGRRAGTHAGPGRASHAEALLISAYCSASSFPRPGAKHGARPSVLRACCIRFPSPFKETLRAAPLHVPGGKGARGARPPPHPSARRGPRRSHSSTSSNETNKIKLAQRRDEAGQSVAWRSACTPREGQRPWRSDARRGVARSARPG